MSFEEFFKKSPPIAPWWTYILNWWTFYLLFAIAVQIIIIFVKNMIPWNLPIFAAGSVEFYNFEEMLDRNEYNEKFLKNI